MVLAIFGSWMSESLWTDSAVDWGHLLSRVWRLAPNYSIESSSGHSPPSCFEIARCVNSQVQFWVQVMYQSFPWSSVKNRCVRIHSIERWGFILDIGVSVPCETKTHCWPVFHSVCNLVGVMSRCCCDSRIMCCLFSYVSPVCPNPWPPACTSQPVGSSHLPFPSATPRK